MKSTTSLPVEVLAPRRMAALLVAALAMLSYRTVIAVAQPPAANSAGDYHALRGGLDNCRLRFELDKVGRVAFLGGSITEGGAWRDLVCGELCQRFPHTQFDFINAGIASMGSTPGSFRFRRDVLKNGPVDLLFAEAAVNDQYNGPTDIEQIRGVEGIVRQARLANPAMDIVLLHFVDPVKMGLINRGQVPPVIANHERIALRYNLPSVDLAREVTERIRDGEFTWERDFVDLHPSPFGHRLYYRSICRLFDAAWKNPPPAGATLVAHTLPDPLDARSYFHGRLASLTDATVENGWKLMHNWTPTDGAGTRPGFVHVPMLVATEPGATLRLRFQGTAVGIFVAAGPDAGTVEYSIDGGPLRCRDLFTEWSGGLHLPWAYVLQADLDEGPHELLLRPAGDKNSIGKGHAVRIAHFLVNGDATVPLPEQKMTRLTREQTNAVQAVTMVLRPATFRHYVDTFNRNDRETVVNHIPNAAAWDWMSKNVPLFECPAKDLEEIYYFRWWTYRKHVKQTPDGYIITEFLPPVPWSGKHNSINCPAGHHFYEGRWLHDPRYLDDYAVFWFRKGGEPRKYSFWAADSIDARSLVLGDDRLPKELLPDLMANYEAWEKGHLDGSGLFWQNDGNDGMEVSIGGSGCRATINSYQYGDAVAIARIAERAGQPDLARTWRTKASALKQLVQEKLWDKEAQFFKILPRGKTSLADVRELHGYTPWYFNLPDPDKSVAWKQLMDPKGFYAPFGPTTAEQRHPRFAVAYQGHECQWNGPSWPLATAVTLTALANLLNHDTQDVVRKDDYWKTFQCYLRSHRFRQLPPEAQTQAAGLTRSFDNTVARHTWWAEERLGRTEWVQYEFMAPVRLEATEVFWYDDPYGIDPPAAWRLLARNGTEWQEVPSKNPYGTAIDRYNRVEFDPLATTSLRLEAKTAAGKSAGILEWRVIQNGTNVAAAATPSASYNDIYAARLSALNDGAYRMERLETRQPWIDENLNPYTGDWIARTLLQQRRQPPDERGKDYNHSTFCDLVISGLVGLRPRADDIIEVNPLVPEGTWDYFGLDQVRYHGRIITILYDKTGEHYGRGQGLRVLVDGRCIAGSQSLQRVTGKLP